MNAVCFNKKVTIKKLEKSNIESNPGFCLSLELFSFISSCSQEKSVIVIKLFYRPFQKIEDK